MTLRELIKSKTREHLDKNGIICCQNMTGIGALQDTFPSEYNSHSGVIEFPTSDSSNSGIATGFALSGRRVIYVVRFGGFMWLNASNLVNYAAICKSMWDVSCPVFVRVMSCEKNIGPVASHTNHGMIMKMPGIPVFAPITSGEWAECWEYFSSHNCPVFCSEHRNSFPIDYEMEDIIRPDAKFTIFAISNARINAVKVAQEFPCNVVHIYKLKPFQPKAKQVKALMDSGGGIVIDTEHECGASQSIAYELMHLARTPVYALGLEDRTAGFAPHCDNLTPSVERIKKLIQDKFPTLDVTIR
jgi:pyruvate/2-oxoglutarate/acetoin dehydrogenase E1 component